MSHSLKITAKIKLQLPQNRIQHVSIIKKSTAKIELQLPQNRIQHVSIIKKNCKNRATLGGVIERRKNSALTNVTREGGGVLGA